MLWLILTVGFAGFTLVSLKGPVERQLNKMHDRKLAKIQANKKTLLLEERVKQLEEELADQVIANHRE